MKNQVIVNKKLKFEGSLGITVSKVDDTVFIVNSLINDPGYPDSLAIYKDSDGKLKSAGEFLVYDFEKNRLSAFDISTNQLTVNHQSNLNEVKTVNIVCDRHIISNSAEFTTLTADLLTVAYDTNLNNVFAKNIISNAHIESASADIGFIKTNRITAGTRSYIHEVAVQKLFVKDKESDFISISAKKEDNKSTLNISVFTDAQWRDIVKINKDRVGLVKLNLKVKKLLTRQSVLSMM